MSCLNRVSLLIVTFLFRFTAADCVIGFTLWWAFTFEGGNLLDGYPVLMNYLQRLKGRPAFQKIFGQDHSFDWKSCINSGFNALGHSEGLAERESE